MMKSVRQVRQNQYVVSATCPGWVNDNLAATSQPCTQLSERDITAFLDNERRRFVVKASKKKETQRLSNRVVIQVFQDEEVYIE